MGVDNTSVARRYMSEIWSKGNLAAVDELVDDKIVVRDNMGTDISGKDKLKEMVTMMQSSFSDNAFDIEDLIVAGDRITILMKWHGKPGSTRETSLAFREPDGRSPSSAATCSAWRTARWSKTSASSTRTPCSSSSARSLRATG
jgi:hypothetical protein